MCTNVYHSTTRHFSWGIYHAEICHGMSHEPWLLATKATYLNGGSYSCMVTKSLVAILKNSNEMKSKEKFLFIPLLTCLFVLCKYKRNYALSFSIRKACSFLLFRFRFHETYIHYCKFFKEHYSSSVR